MACWGDQVLHALKAHTWEFWILLDGKGNISIKSPVSQKHKGNNLNKEGVLKQRYMIWLVPEAESNSWSAEGSLGENNVYYAKVAWIYSTEWENH